MQALEVIFPPRDYVLLLVIVGLPLIGAFVNGVFGRRLGKEAVTLMGLSSVGVSFLASVLAFFMLKERQTEDAPGRFVWTGWDWLGVSFMNETTALVETGAADRLKIEVALSIDVLSGTMALIVTGVGFLIHLYSTKYMEHDDGYHRFFAYLNLFIFSMLVLILGDSLPILFVGWEGVGLCSYLLIGFWFSSEANAQAGKKAFITNRIGDFGLLVAMALLVRYTGALSWDGIFAGAQGLLTPVTVWHIPWLEGSSAPEWLVGQHQVSAATLVGLSLFLGCAGKSAQIPLYVWLPDAMAGPTPVSALIHAATMVTAGVYLVCRMAPIFVLSPAVMFTVACVGAVTAVFAATIAFVQNDIKKVLAYSTVSQLGYMFLGVGVGAFTAGFFHVVTHAFFKACLFLGAGSVIHAIHARIHDTDASQDVRNMGGLKDFLPTTFWTFTASCLAIAGMPLLSGFFSKDAILLATLQNTPQPPRDVIRGGLELFTWPEWAGTLLFGLGAVGAVMTAFYMFRLLFLTFFGDFKGWTIVDGWKAPEGDDHHAHDDDEELEGPVPLESPWQMTVPLTVLGVLAIGGGFWNAHIGDFLHMEHMTEWLAPVFAPAAAAIAVDTEAGGMVPIIAILAFAVGAGGAFWVYQQNDGVPADELAEKVPGLHALVLDKWRIDELYDEFIIGTLDFIADIFVWVDRWVVDGIIAGLSAWLVAVSGHLLRLIQTGRVQVYSAAMTVGMAGVLWFMTVPHPAAVVESDEVSGKVRLSATPGLGYAYRWDADGDGEFDNDEFSDQLTVDLTLNLGEQRVVVLQVKNAFGRIRSRDYTVARPNLDGTLNDDEPTEEEADATGALVEPSDTRLAARQGGVK